MIDATRHGHNLFSRSLDWHSINMQAHVYTHTQAAFVKYQGGDLVKYQILTGAQNKEETGASRLSTGDA